MAGGAGREPVVASSMDSAATVPEGREERYMRLFLTEVFGRRSPTHGSSAKRGRLPWRDDHPTDTGTTERLPGRFPGRSPAGRDGCDQIRQRGHITQVHH